MKTVKVTFEVKMDTNADSLVDAINTAIQLDVEKEIAAFQQQNPDVEIELTTKANIYR